MSYDFPYMLEDSEDELPTQTLTRWKTLTGKIRRSKYSFPRKHLPLGVDNDSSEPIQYQEREVRTFH